MSAEGRAVRILGINPGTLRLGYGVIEARGGVAVRYVECGVISAPARHARPARLAEIGRGLRELIAEARPDTVAMEEAFFGKNVQATLALGEARGVALLVVTEAGLPLAGYPPATVKQSVVGHGRATKDQVGFLVRALLSLRRVPSADAADALAIAICHARNLPAPARGGGGGGGRVVVGQGGNDGSVPEERPAAGAPAAGADNAGTRRVIAFLRGRVLEKDAESTVLDVGGVGYAVAISAAAAQGLGAMGAEARLWIHSHAVQDGPMQLFGFIDREERTLFQTLLGVQGVGPKVALAILSGLPVAELQRAIAGADIARLQQIRGVGKKTAERLAVELRDKLVPFPVGPGAAAALAAGGGRSMAPAGPALPERLAEVQGALLTLGYRAVEIDPLFERLDPTRSAEELVRQALAALRRA